MVYKAFCQLTEGKNYLQGIFFSNYRGGKGGGSVGVDVLAGATNCLHGILIDRLTDIKIDMHIDVYIDKYIDGNMSMVN